MPKMRVRGKPQHRDVLSIALKATGNHAGRSCAAAPVNLGGPGWPSRQPGCPRRLPRQPGRLPRQAGIPGQPSPPSRAVAPPAWAVQGGRPASLAVLNGRPVNKTSEHLQKTRSTWRPRNHFQMVAKCSEVYKVHRSSRHAPKSPGHTTRATAVCCSPKFTQRTKVPGHRAALKPQIRDCP